MGGIYVDETHRTSMKNLYAAGECACQYHGANRLGGNSLLGAVYGGKVAAESVMKSYNNDTVKKAEGKAEKVSPEISHFISETLKISLPIIRNEKDMLNAKSSIESKLQDGINNAERRRLNLALAMVMSALNRKESRGAHKRIDYPEISDIYKKTTVATYNGASIKITMRSIPEPRKDDEV